MNKNLRIQRVSLAGLRLLAGLLLLSGLAQPCAAQTEFSGLPEPGVPVFDFDVAPFRGAGDSTRLEIYYRITNPRLSYIRKGDQYVASYEITAVMTGGGDRQAASASNRENYSLPSYEETRRTSGYLVNLLIVSVLPGEYTLTMTLNDRISGSTYTASRPVDLSMMSTKDGVIGGPEFILPGAEAPSDERYAKGETAVVPNVRRSFSGGGDRLAVYFEVYPQREDPITHVVVETYQRALQRRLRDTLVVDPTRRVARFVYRNALTQFRTGETRLRIGALDARGNDVGHRVESVFSIDWSFATMVKEDWAAAVDMLVHMATKDEMDTLRSVPEHKRAEAFEEFWKSKDPTPESEENEWKDEYYRRIRFANQLYANPFRPGWRTDFGMVYIKYGEPDDVERYPFEIGQKPHEIWYYYGQRREFLFIDLRGNGEYELQYPYDGIVR